MFSFVFSFTQILKPFLADKKSIEFYGRDGGNGRIQLEKVSYMTKSLKILPKNICYPLPSSFNPTQFINNLIRFSVQIFINNGPPKNTYRRRISKENLERIPNTYFEPHCFLC